MEIDGVNSKEFRMRPATRRDDLLLGEKIDRAKAHLVEDGLAEGHVLGGGELRLQKRPLHNGIIEAVVAPGSRSSGPLLRRRDRSLLETRRDATSRNYL
jgi:hypothetical protein